VGPSGEEEAPNPKIQIPGTKFQIPNKFQYPIPETIRTKVVPNLEIENWDLFGIWGLGFSAWKLVSFNSAFRL
jgi:hypothetical protein